MDVEIDNLEVRFEADAADDEQTFHRLFEREIRRWSRQVDEHKQRERWLEAERRLAGGDGEM